MHDRNLVGRVRMRVAFGRPAVRRPAGVADADIAAKRIALEPLRQRGKLALGAASRKMAVFKLGNIGEIAAARFETLECVDHMSGDRCGAENSYDPAHSAG